jgi:hypothetical protein
LNAQIPTYDKAVAVTDSLQRTKGEVNTIAVSAVDWASVVSELTKATPNGLSLSTFSGTGTPPGGAPAAAGGPTSAGGTATTTPATAGVGGSTAGAVGTVSVNVGGTFPSQAHFSPVAEWIDNITGASMFDPPGVSSVSNTPSGGNTNVTFQSTLSLTSFATLAKNGRY